MYWTGVHDLDTMRAVVGDEVREVHALVGSKIADYTEYENVISVSLRFEGGAIGTLQVSDLDPLRSFEDSLGMSVLCEEGSVRYVPERMTIEHARRSGQKPGEITKEAFRLSRKTSMSPSRRVRPSRPRRWGS